MQWKYVLLPTNLSIPQWPGPLYDALIGRSDVGSLRCRLYEAARCLEHQVDGPAGAVVGGRGRQAGRSADAFSRQ